MWQSLEDYREDLPISMRSSIRSAVATEPRRAMRHLVRCVHNGESGSRVDDRFRDLAVARGAVLASIRTYWAKKYQDKNDVWSLHPLPDGLQTAVPSDQALVAAAELGRALADHETVEASYLAGSVYTELMPKTLRGRLGAYYTPPPLCERLLDMATAAGVDWRTDRVLDPACGGGAFLSPVARLMANSNHVDETITVDEIADRLTGYELDPFAAWLSHVFLEDTLSRLCMREGRRLPRIVHVRDAIDADVGAYDLVVANPPYGRVRLSQKRRERYRRSLHGHANLYGVFMDLAVRLTRPGGVIALVTPTSFLAGEYFKALRALIAAEAPPSCFGFVDRRKGVFEGVLQETLLSTYRRGAPPGIGTIQFITSNEHTSVTFDTVGSFRLPMTPTQPWIIPRTKEQAEIVGWAADSPYRLKDYGYKVSTGPLVWNRHKHGLRAKSGLGRYPLVWAEAVRSDGTFEHRAVKQNHLLYFEPRDGEKWVVTNEPCVLVQRTTAKEQPRRIVAAALPDTFVARHGAVVIENHLNMIRPKDNDVATTPEVLSALLRSTIVDTLFRAIAGSVAVSAFEIESLPLPNPLTLPRLSEVVQGGASLPEIDRIVEELYAEGRDAP